MKENAFYAQEKFNPKENDYNPRVYNLHLALQHFFSVKNFQMTFSQANIIVRKLNYQPKGHQKWLHN